MHATSAHAAIRTVPLAIKARAAPSAPPSLNEREPFVSKEREPFPPPLAREASELWRTRRSACGAKAGRRAMPATTRRERQRIPQHLAQPRRLAVADEPLLHGFVDRR